MLALLREGDSEPATLECGAQGVCGIARRRRRNWRGMLGQARAAVEELCAAARGRARDRVDGAQACGDAAAASRRASRRSSIARA